MGTLFEDYSGRDDHLLHFRQKGSKKVSSFPKQVTIRSEMSPQTKTVRSMTKITKKWSKTENFMNFRVFPVFRVLSVLEVFRAGFERGWSMSRGTTTPCTPPPITPGTTTRASPSGIRVWRVWHVSEGFWGVHQAPFGFNSAAPRPVHQKTPFY